MKEFIRTTLATLTGLLIFAVAGMIIMFSIIGAVAAIGSGTPMIPAEAVLKIDMSEMTLTEQTKEVDPVAMIQGNGQSMVSVGILSAIRAINAAAEDPAIRFIYMKPDAVMAGKAQIEELRDALSRFRESGKAIVSYIESPTNDGYYLASVSDKIYMSVHDGGMNMFTGVSSQMIFLKDILNKLGVNVQLIRHGKYKSAGEMYVRNAPSKENMEQNEEMIASIWDSWAEKIAQSREISVEDLDTMLDRLELNFPSDFLEKGLVDELVTLEQMNDKLCTLFMTDRIESVKAVSLADYAKAKENLAVKGKDKIAVIFVEGNIVDQDQKQQVSGDRFSKIISDVRKDSTVKAVVLRVNSPGGSVLAAEKIKSQVDLLKERVPVIASYGNYAASGGYWISAGTDYIFSNATTLTGSIGVFSMIPDFGGTVENKLHINITPVNSNRHSDMYNMLRPLDEAETRYMQASVENIYQKFVNLVAEGRGMSFDEVDAIAQGRVWTGSQAIGNGLVDQIGTIYDAVYHAASSIGIQDINSIRIEEYPKPQTTIEMLMEMLGEGSTALSGTPLENIGKAFKAWNPGEYGKVYARMPYEILVR